MGWITAKDSKFAQRGQIYGYGIKNKWIISDYFNNREDIMRKLDAVALSSKSSETPSASLPSNNIIPDTTYADRVSLDYVKEVQD